MAETETKPIILVASATANTGSHAVRALAASGKCIVRAFARKADDPRLESFRDLNNVEIVEGDLEVKDTVVKALEGVKRVILVSSPFVDNLFWIEASFIEWATDAGVEGVIRISTASPLCKYAGTKCTYGRHHCAIEAFCRGENAYRKSFPVVHLNPSWFTTNISLFFGQMIQGNVLIWPAPADCIPFAAVSPADVGSACATCALCDKSDFDKMLLMKNLEVHGPELVTWGDMLAELGKALGRQIDLILKTDEEWAQMLAQGGMKYKYAKSLADTIQVCSGVNPEHWPTKSSAILYSLGWEPKGTIYQWANDSLTKSLCTAKKEASEDVEEAGEAKTETAAPETTTTQTNKSAEEGGSTEEIFE